MRKSILYLFLFIIPQLAGNTAEKKVTVFVIGDSTSCVYSSSVYPRTGWAQILQPFFQADSVTVNDQAASGRSSKSFYDEGKWNTVYNLLKPGDFVLIQFAHNDEKTTDATRYTNPATTFRDYMCIYINGAIAKGATPVLISSIPRNNWSGSGIQQAHKPYTQAMIELADSFHIPFIDMEAATMKYLNLKGKAFATDSIYNNLKAGVWPNYIMGNSDGTHLQERGAFQFCKVVTDEFANYRGHAGFERLARNLQPASRISAMPSPDLKGSITGCGIFAAPSNRSLKAVSVTGYRFVKWTLAQDTVSLGTDPTLNLDLEEKEINLTAHFAPITGLDDSHVSSLEVFPNPVQDKLNIYMEGENWTVELADLNGKQLLFEKNKSQIKMGGFPAGMYLLKVQSGQNKSVQIIHKL